MNPGRLAIREEGTNWNAYFAKPDTMEGAVFLGSKTAFMELMKAAVGGLLQEITKSEVTWNEATPAPEQERTKRA